MKITKVKADKVVRIYSGRPGCMCGCQGTYYEDRKAIARIVANMNKFVANGNAEFEVDEINGKVSNYVFAENREDGGPQRTYVAYFA